MPAAISILGRLQFLSEKSLYQIPTQLWEYHARKVLGSYSVSRTDG